MVTRSITAVVTVCILLSGVFTVVRAQPQPQIPTLQVCKQTGVKGKAVVKIHSRGTFTVDIALTCDPEGEGYPVGRLEISALDMSDSIVQGVISAVTFEQLTSTGKNSPTVYLNGRCRAQNAKGCRFWLMIADNIKPEDKQGTADVVSFLVLDGVGKRVAYGTGPVVEGDIVVKPE